MMLLFFISQYFFLQSPLFNYRELEIEGANRVKESLIESHLGLQGTDSFLSLSPNDLEQNLSDLHRLKAATVTLDFPGRVQVQVAERRPAFFAAFRGEKQAWYSVDSEGIILEEVPTPAEGHKFFLSHTVREGQKVRPKDLEVVRFFQDQLKGELKKRVRVVNISQTRQLALKVVLGKNPVWVRLGRPEKLEYKLFLLNELLRQLDSEKDDIRSIDLRYSAPVVTKRG